MPEKLTPADRASWGNAHEAQAANEGVSLAADGKVEFKGSTFKMADKIGLWPLIAFSMAQKRGIDAQDGGALAALGEMILDCIDESEHQRFGLLATETKAEADDFMRLIQTCIETIAARPTTPPGDSSAGRPTTPGNSKVPSLTEGMVSPADLAR